MDSLSLAGTEVSLVSDLLRYLSFLLDLIAYSLIPLTFDLITKLYALPEAISNLKALDTLSKSIYSLLAIFMFFKVAFSLLGMLVDPSMIADKEKGAGKLVSNIFITLVLIVAVPIAFDYAMKAQTTIMEKQLIEKAVFGEDFSEDDKMTLGKRISLAVWGLFLQPTTTEGKAAEAYDSIFNKNEDASAILFFNINATTSDNTSFFERLTTFYIGATSMVVNPIGGAYLIAQSFGIGQNNRYQVAYIAIVSFICGFTILWSFVKMCIDVAYRAIKLYALRMLSPIAIISYIDPKSGKNGVFSKWIAECVKTYASLFVRIFVFALAAVILKEIDVTNAGDTFIERLFFTLAVVAFVKTAPKFIDGILGTELSKESESKFGSDLLKQGLGGLGMAAVGGAVGLATATKLGYNGGRGFWEGTKAGFTGGIEAVNKKDPIGVITGLAKAGNGANAMRKYYGLPTAAEDRKQRTEADLAKRSAEDFTENKNSVSQKRFDKMKPPEFDSYLRELPANAENDEWKRKWNEAATFKDKAKVKQKYAESLFDAKNNDAAAMEALEKLNPGRSAVYRNSYGTSKAVLKEFGEKSDIGKAWLKAEENTRQKIMYEQEVENWRDLAQRADTAGGKLYHIGSTLDSSDPNKFYDSIADALEDKKIGVIRDYQLINGERVAIEQYSYNGTQYETVEEAMQAAHLTDLKAVGIKELQDQQNFMQQEVNNAEKQVSDAVKEKQEAMKVPGNAAAARRAKLIDAGRERGF